MSRRRRTTSDFGAEIEAHLDLEVERLREQGLSEEEARAAARRAFGNVTHVQERFYESGRWLWWDRLWQSRFGGDRDIIGRHVTIDGEAYTVVGVMASGLAPACENSRHKLNRTLKEASGQASDSKRSARLRRIFVAAEVALAVVVLITTTLLVKSFIRSVRASTGYNPANVMVAQLALPKTKYTQESRLRTFSEDVLASRGCRR